MPARILTPISLTAIVLSLLLPLPVSAQIAQAQADTSKPLIEIRFGRRTPAPDFRHITVPAPLRVVFANDSLYVSNKTVFTDSSFVDVRAVVRPSNGLVLNISWKPDAAERFTQILRGQFDAGIDQLAVFVDGELMTSSAIIVSPNAGRPTGATGGRGGTGGGPISLPNVPDETASRIATAVAKRWPRRGRSE